MEYNYMRKNELAGILRLLAGRYPEFNSKELCKKMGVPTSSYSMWISGKAYPREAYIKKIEDFYGIRLDELRGSIPSDTVELGDLLNNYKILVAGKELSRIGKNLLLDIAIQINKNDI